VDVLLIYNPTAGDEEVEPEELVSPLRAAGYDVEARSIGRDWEPALEGDHGLVLVAGGDGAVAKVLKRLSGTDKVAALLPSGSANNIAKALGYRADESDEELIRGLTDAKRVRFDVGQASWDGVEHLFVESAGSGVFADLLARADRLEAHPGGEEKIELGLRLLSDAAASAPVHRYEIEADGADLSGDYIAVEAANVGLVSVNVPLATDARPCDGLLDLALLRDGDRATLVEYATARLEDRSPPDLDLTIHRASRIELRIPPDRPFHLDDGLVAPGAERHSLKVVSGLEVLVPR
jgi:diacylglycerol kinase (ATP)